MRRNKTPSQPKSLSQVIDELAATPVERSADCSALDVKLSEIVSVLERDYGVLATPRQTLAAACRQLASSANLPEAAVGAASELEEALEYCKYNTRSADFDGSAEAVQVGIAAFVDLFRPWANERTKSNG